MDYEHFPGQRKNILSLKRLFDQLGANNNKLYSSMDIAKILDNQGITYTKLMGNPDLLAMYRNDYIDSKHGRWQVNYRRALQ